MKEPFESRGYICISNVFLHAVYCTNFHMYFTTYQMMYSLLHVRREEFTSYVAENMKRKEVLCLLFQEQLFIYGAAFVFGLINGMLF